MYYTRSRKSSHTAVEHPCLSTVYTYITIFSCCVKPSYALLSRVILKDRIFSICFSRIATAYSISLFVVVSPKVKRRSTEHVRCLLLQYGPRMNPSSHLHHTHFLSQLQSMRSSVMTANSVSMPGIEIFTLFATLVSLLPFILISGISLWRRFEHEVSK